MMKLAALALLAVPAAAFAPAQQSERALTSLNAERSKSLPFMNRPPLVSPISAFLCLLAGFYRSTRHPLALIYMKKHLLLLC